MDRKDFLAKIGMGAAASLLAPICMGGLAACSKTGAAAPTNVDFNLDVSTGSLAVNGGFLVTNGIAVARTNAGSFLAVSASCPHEGTNVNYSPGNNNFVCPNHGAKFNNVGVVTQGPATSNLAKYNTTLTGTTLRVFS